jgi:hypothetical protein
LVQLTDFFNLVFQMMVIGNPLFHELLLFRAKADMTDLATRLANCQDQDWMSLPPRALGAARLVADGPLQQRSTQQFGGGEIRSELVAPFHGVLAFHWQ